MLSFLKKMQNRICDICLTPNDINLDCIGCSHKVCEKCDPLANVCENCGGRLHFDCVYFGNVCKPCSKKNFLKELWKPNRK